MLTQGAPLGYYGIHDDDGVSYLYQDVCPYGWEFIGLNRKSNLTVKHLKNQCSHNINVNLATRELSKIHLRKFNRVVTDPLVQTMLPIPNGKTYFLDETKLPEAANWLACLERLNSPLHTWVKPLFAVNKGHAAKHLGMTNIHPMVFVDLTPHDSDTVLRLATIAKTSPRTVIFCGDPKIVIPKHIERLETNLSSLTTLQDLISLPLEHLGSYVLSKYCKGTRSFEKVA
tara:strand:- start:2496 stop:3182 length:687 start_codon:yes stop_codon:yes gene_type:complete